MRKLMVWIGKALEFVTVDIWRISLEELPKTKSFLIRQVRIIMLAVKGFKEDKIQLRASALTFYSMLSVVPVFALIFGIAKGFGFDEKMQGELIKNFQGHKEVLNWIINFANQMLANAKGGFIAGVGVVILLWSVMKVLGNIEEAFNGIWQIRKSRTFVRKFSDYFSIILIAPVFFFLSSSATVFISAQVSKYQADYPVLENLRFLVQLGPYILIWILFILLYIVMPNTRVRFKSALIGGIIAGSVFQVVQWGYIHFQIGVSRYGAIYGSFAAIPLFIIWLQLSWLIVLLGAEISFANQNVKQYEFESDSLHISLRMKRLLTLLVANLVIRNFAEGKDAYSASGISENLKLPMRLVREIIYELIDIKVFAELASDNPKERKYQPAMDINQLTINKVLMALDKRGSHFISPKRSLVFDKLNTALTSFETLIKDSKKNVLIKDLQQT